MLVHEHSLASLLNSQDDMSHPLYSILSALVDSLPVNSIIFVGFKHPMMNLKTALYSDSINNGTVHC